MLTRTGNNFRSELEAFRHILNAADDRAGLLVVVALLARISLPTFGCASGSDALPRLKELAALTVDLLSATKGLQNGSRKMPALGFPRCISIQFCVSHVMSFHVDRPLDELFELPSALSLKRSKILEDLIDLSLDIYEEGCEARESIWRASQKIRRQVMSRMVLITVRAVMVEISGL